MRQLLICFDVDGTLIDDTVFIWQTLHDAFDTDREERKHWSDAFWSKKITYAQWAAKDVEMWQAKGATRSGLMDHIKQLTPMKGAQETLDTLKADGHILGVISGSLDIALEHAFPSWNDLFAHVFLNRLEFDENGFLTGIKATPFDIEHKATGLKEMSQRTGIGLKDTVFIGDNFNDVSVAKLAGLAIAFNCKSEELANASDVVIGEDSLTEIIPVIRRFLDSD